MSRDALARLARAKALFAEATRFHRAGQLDQAAAAYQAALQTWHDSAEAHNNLGALLVQMGRSQQAVTHFRQALSINPRSVSALTNLGNALHTAGELEAALFHLRRAVALQPASPDAHYNLGRTLVAAGEIGEGIAAYREALRLRPDFPAAQSNLLLALHYDPLQTPEGIFAEHVAFGRQHDRWEPLVPASSTPPAGDPERRLRVGYVSADLRTHSVAFFLEPLLAAHDRDRFQVFAYASVAQPDATTSRLRTLVDSWRDIHGLTDEAAAARIHEDRIDILVDLGGHTGGSRLLVFARRPAPVQVAYLGYPDTTGLPAMDYRLTDALADPPEDADARHTEQLVRLPEGFLCYAPPPDSPPVAPSPAATARHVTFGSFNNLQKLSQPVITAWAAILLAAPETRLLLKSQAVTAYHRERLTAAFAARGVSPDRVELRDPAPTVAEHLAAYAEVDIALDTFPYNGTTTTCEALWMGVPVLTLAGAIHAGRAGVSLLTHAGVPDLIAQSVDEYVAKAVALAADRAQLAVLRRQLRPHFAASPVMDRERVTRTIETAYRDMWRRRCGAYRLHSHLAEGQAGERIG